MPVTEARLLEILDSWGADPAAWPAGERAGALALLQARPDLFGQALAEALALDELLAALPLPMPSDALTASILSGAVPGRPPRAARWASPVQAGRLRPVAGLVAAAAGLVMGLMAAPATGGTQPDELETLVVAVLGFDMNAYSLEVLP